MAFCSKCGQQVNEDARFCERCGQQRGAMVQKSQEETIPSISGNKKKASVIIIMLATFVVLLVVGIAAGGALWYTSIKNAQQTSGTVNTNTNEAKAIRSTAVKAMELHAVDNDGSYLGGDSDALSALETSIRFVNSPGGVNEAYVHDQKSDGYVIDVLGRDGVTYTATKDNGGAVVIEP